MNCISKLPIFYSFEPIHLHVDRGPIKAQFISIFYYGLKLGRSNIMLNFRGIPDSKAIDDAGKNDHTNSQTHSFNGFGLDLK